MEKKSLKHCLVAQRKFSESRRQQGMLRKKTSADKKEKNDEMYDPPSLKTSGNHR